MVREEVSCQGNDLGPEPQGEQRLDQEAHEASGKNRQQKMPEVHFKPRRGEHHDLEGRGGRQHRGKHQRPEFVLLERRVDLRKFFRRQAFAQQNLAAGIADGIDHDAAQSAACRRQEYIEQKPRPVVVHVADKYRVQRHAQEGAVHGGKRQHPPGAEGRKNVLDPLSVSVDKMFDLGQVR